jgi:glycosyltransferase involved in cell wall biosynthesis
MSCIYFLSPPDTEPSGGIKHLYRQVDILNRNGYSAAVVHDRPAFRHTWFENQTRVVHTSDVKFAADDFLVFPEVFGPQVSTFAPGAREVVFNQNCYRTFTLYGLDKDRSAPSYLDSDVQAVIVASRLRRGVPASRVSVEAAFPDHVRHRRDTLLVSTCQEAQPGVHAASLARGPRPGGQPPQVSRRTRRCGSAPIDGMSERQVAAALKESLVFLSFSSREGFGLPPAEAMACGCIAIGYAGGGGVEYLLPELSYPVPDGDIVAFARTVEQVLTEHARDPGNLAEMARRASAFVLDKYSMAR